MIEDWNSVRNDSNEDIVGTKLLSLRDERTILIIIHDASRNGNYPVNISDCMRVFQRASPTV